MHLRHALLTPHAPLATGCPHPPLPPVTRPEEAMRPAAKPVPLLDDGDLASFRAALQESIAWLSSQPPDRAFVFGPRSVSADAEREALQRLLTLLDMNPDAQAVSDFVGRIFDVEESAGGADGSVLFTGYYEPEIEASLTPSPDYA